VWEGARDGEVGGESKRKNRGKRRREEGRERDGSDHRKHTLHVQILFYLSLFTECQSLPLISMHTCSHITQIFTACTVVAMQCIAKVGY
jgi:isoprenylcysteine carboxyl methyltransferase (ICMT) family protein YpbQ